MKFGIHEVFSTESSNKQCVVTEFWCVVLPLYPKQSYFVHYNKSHSLRLPIPLNRQNIIKNYASLLLLMCSVLLVLSNFILGDTVLLNSQVSSVFYHLNLWGVPLGLIEKGISIVCVGFTLYFLFWYGRLSVDEKHERLLIQYGEYWNSILPGRDLSPIAGKYYSQSDQLVLFNQLLVLLFRVSLKLDDEPYNEMEHNAKTTALRSSLARFIDNKEYELCDDKTLALLFTILGLQKRIEPTSENLRTYQKLKKCLWQKISYGQNNDFFCGDYKKFE